MQLVVSLLEESSYWRLSELGDSVKRRMTALILHILSETAIWAFPRHGNPVRYNIERVGEPILCSR